MNGIKKLKSFFFLYLNPPKIFRTDAIQYSFIVSSPKRVAKWMNYLLGNCRAFQSHQPHKSALVRGWTPRFPGFESLYRQNCFHTSPNQH